MSVIRLAWLLVLLGFSCLARADDRRPRSPTTSGTAPPPTARPPSGCTTSFRPPARIARRPSRSSPNSQARNPWLEVKRYSVKDHRGNARFYYETAQTLGAEALSVPGFVFCRQIIIGYDSAETTGKQLADALQACHDRRAREPRCARSCTDRRWRQRHRGHPAIGRRGESRHDGQPAVHRPGGRQGVLAPGAHAGARGHGCVQSLRILRAAVPAEPAGPRQEPHAHGDRRRHVRAVLRTRLFRVHGRVAQRLPDRRRTARDHDRSRDWSR